MFHPFPFSPARPVVLLTDWHPAVEGGSAVILRSLLSKADWSSVICVTPAPKLQASDDSEMRVIHLQSGSAGRGGKRRSVERDMVLYASRLAREVADIAEAHHAQAFWVILHGAMVMIAEHLQRLNSLPMHGVVHDDPPFATSLRSRRQRLLVPWVAHQFRRVLQRLRTCEVICEPMRQRYLQRYGVDSVVIHRGLQHEVAAGTPMPPSEAITIGVLGNTYSYGPLRQLAGAVINVARRTRRRGRVVVIGQSFGERLSREFSHRLDVEVAGHLPESAGIDRLRRCNALYLNYPFGTLDGVLRQTSFPTKLSTYLQAARPILLHAPEDSSTFTLREYDDLVACWASTTERQGALAIERLLALTTTPQRMASVADKIRRRYFCFVENRARLIATLRRCVELETGACGAGKAN